MTAPVENEEIVATCSTEVLGSSASGYAFGTNGELARRPKAAASGPRSRGRPVVWGEPGGR